MSELELRLRLRAGLKDFHSYVPVVTFATNEGATLKYVPDGIHSLDGPLEENRSLVLNGRTGLEMYEQVIKPKL